MLDLSALLLLVLLFLCDLLFGSFSLQQILWGLIPNLLFILLALEKNFANFTNAGVILLKLVDFSYFLGHGVKSSDYPEPEERKQFLKRIFFKQFLRLTFHSSHLSWPPNWVIWTWQHLRGSSLPPIRPLLGSPRWKYRKIILLYSRLASKLCNLCISVYGLTI